MCGCAQHARDGGVLPTTGFPRDGGMANEERAKTSLGHGANTSISYNTQAFVHGRSSRGYTFEACIFGADQVRCNVEEVDVLTTVVEVVVHGRSGSSRTQSIDVRRHR